MFKKLVASILIALCIASNAWALNSPYYGTYNWLSTGVKTTSQYLPDQSGLYVTGVEVVCVVTAASGTGGLQVKIQGKEPITGTYYDVASTTNLNTTGVPRVIAGANVFTVTSTSTAGNVNTYIPYTWRLAVVHGDSSNYNYSCSYTAFSSS